MKKLLTITFLTVIVLGIAASEANAQTAYGVSIVRGNLDTRIVDGYSGTWLDYYAGLYYDPEVMGQLYRTDDIENTLSSGRHIGYADIIPAEVYLRTTNFVEGMSYCTYSQHFVWSIAYYPANNYWFDPFRYSLIYTGNPPWGGYPFSYYYVPPRRYRLGSTEACITIPTTPLPTPTPVPPTPTPVPTPTPCDTASLGCAPGYDVYMPMPPPVRPTGTSSFSGGGTTTPVKVCTDPIQVNLQATLRLNRLAHHANSGGHIGSLHSGPRPIGKLASQSGRTAADGCFTTTYSSSHISGIVGVTGTIGGASVGQDILIRVNGLFPLGEGLDHKLCCQTTSHPDSHYGTALANTGLRRIAQDYRFEYYPSTTMPDSAKLHYNDMSLVYGGKFDLGKGWSNAGHHGEHREGINTDVRCCATPGDVPRTRWARLNDFFEIHGSTRTNDETDDPVAPHWHLRFEFGTPRIAERTPHSFVEDAFDAALLRESNQSEYENWHTRIMNAKTAGQAELLLEAKLFQREIFAQSEYAARRRTSEEFVSDVYWSHMSREPSQQEIDDWVAYMQNLPPSVPANRREARMIEQVQLLQEFQDVVFGIVDASLSMPQR